MRLDKQIEKIADILCEAKGHNCDGGDDCRCVKQAEALYNAGYRKASDDAREIFEEIDNLLYQDERDYDDLMDSETVAEIYREYLACSNYIYGVREAIAELKKKYTEGGK